MIKYILFDLDGTLIDNEKFTIISKVIEGKKLGYQISEEVAKNTLGLSCENSKNYLCSIYGKDFPYEYFRSKRFEYIVDDVEKNGLKLKPGVNEIISYCKKNNIKIAICTSSSWKYLNFYKKHSSIFEQFGLIVTGEEIKNGKPDPEIFLYAINHFNAKSNETLVIEDSNNGIIAGLKAGCDVVMIPDLITPNQEIKNSKVKIFNSMLDVIKYIDEVNKKKV